MQKLHRKCLNLAYETGWKLPKGYDQGLREFYCVWCDEKFYIKLGDKELQNLRKKEE